MTDHPRRTTLPSAAPGWLRYFILLLSAITALPLTAAPRPDIKGHVVSDLDLPPDCVQLPLRTVCALTKLSPVERTRHRILSPQPQFLRSTP